MLGNQVNNIECIQWNTFTKRIIEEVKIALKSVNGVKENGIVKIKITMIAGLDGPFILEIDSTRIEPYNRAKEFLLG